MGLLGLKNFLSGEAAALADYRVLLAADSPAIPPFLHSFSESSWGAPVEQFVFDGRRFSRSALNYLLGLALYKKHVSSPPRTVLEIGGGFGSLGEILAASGVENSRYIDIDIAPTAYVAHSYLSHIYCEDEIVGYSETAHESRIQIEKLPRCSVLCSWQIERLVGSIDLFVNYISFQEMEPEIVKNYLSHVLRLNARHILLRNLKEGHRIVSDSGKAGVSVPTKGDDYLCWLPGYEVLERQTHPFGFQTVDGFNSECILLGRSKNFL